MSVRQSHSTLDSATTTAAMATVMYMVITMAGGRTVGTAEAAAGRTAVEAGGMAEAGVEPAW